MTQSRETRERLWRDLLVRSAVTPRKPYPPLWVVVAAALLSVIALYLFAQL